MLVNLDYEKILNQKDAYQFIDVRSPKEFAEATIPGAVNIPLFNNEQRQEIGRVYKVEGKEASISLGIEYISERLPGVYQAFCREHKTNKKKLALFCARGGMRSTSIGSLLQSMGMPVVKLNSGYKGYRNYINLNLQKVVESVSFVTLYGKTGTGKTYILNEIKELGYTVLDLEKCANHRGSLLGSIGLKPCHSQKMFESLVFDSLYHAKGAIVFTEGESKRIGNIIMPDYLYGAILNSCKILISADITKRVENITKEYLSGTPNTNEIIQALSALEKWIGSQKTKDYVEAVKESRYSYVIQELIETYYDHTYSTKNKSYEMNFTNKEEKQTAQNIIGWVFQHRNTNNSLFG